LRPSIDATSGSFHCRVAAVCGALGHWTTRENRIQPTLASLAIERNSLTVKQVRMNGEGNALAASRTASTSSGPNEHIGWKLIPQGIRIAGGGRELGEHAGLSLPALCGPITELPQQAPWCPERGRPAAGA
jgi:hypothetical protein